MRTSGTRTRRATPAIGLAALLAIPAFALPSSAGATFTHTARTVAMARPAAFLQQRRMLSYPFEQVWPTAIRFLRVDRGYGIEDRDQDAGYILFTFDAGGGQGTGSLEMFRTKDPSGRESVTVMVNTTSGPSHLPHTLLEGIARKVREERGQPAPPPKPPSEDPDAPEGPDDGPDQDAPDGGDPPMMPPPLDPGRPKKRRGR